MKKPKLLLKDGWHPLNKFMHRQYGSRYFYWVVQIKDGYPFALTGLPEKRAAEQKLVGKRYDGRPEHLLEVEEEWGITVYDLMIQTGTKIDTSMDGSEDDVYILDLD